ncbi:sodium:solute symporter family transporter [Parasphingorhabdus sp.]|uniref:sodium:solute symporter family transporter n=1 Tax=Parasphingorhabdus sp. TaxID=2709688 RepID=UPI003A8E3092
MNGLDYSVIIIYLAAMLAFGIFLSRQADEGDYFLGNKAIAWFPLALSAMATQLSAISFISAPAFVGLREGGGLKWLTFEFALPLAMLLVMFVIMPALYRSGVVSIYDFLEQRIGRSTRFAISFSFQIVRAFGTGIMVYATGLIIHAVLGIAFIQSVLVISIITIIYSFLGGIRAVVYADAIQMVLIVIGLLTCLIFAIATVGGIEPFWSGIDPQRLRVVDWSYAGLVTDEFALLPMLFGGFVLYVSYYACDQTQAQRSLSAKSLGDIRKLLMANALLRFPIALLYCLTGLAIGVVAASNSELLMQIPDSHPDYLMPLFILEYLPHGVIGLLLVAIMSAAMSTLSSAVNSLSAVTMEDMASFGIRAHSKRQEVFVARLMALVWGGLILVFSAYAGDIAATVIEAVNKLGSALYGPVMGVFLIAILWKRRTVLSTNIGFLSGVLLNLYCWQFHPQLFWMWWNLIGLVVTMAVAMLLSLASGKMPLADRIFVTQQDGVSGAFVLAISVWLFLFTIAIILLSLSIQWLQAG